MYDSDDRPERKILGPPTGFEALDKRVVSTLWLHTQLSKVQRAVSSKRILSLRSELKEILDSDTFIPYEVLLNEKLMLQTEILNLKARLDQRQSELDNRPTREIEKVVYLDTTVPRPSIDLPSAPTPRIGQWIVISIIGLIIFIVYRVLHS